MENKLFSVIRIGFVNSETGNMDETEFDTDDQNEAMCLFRDFCEENGFGKPEVLYSDVYWIREFRE